MTGDTSFRSAWWPRRQDRTDWWEFAVAGFGLLSVVVEGSSTIASGGMWATWPALLAMLVALTIRRRWPTVAVVIAVAAAVAMTSLDQQVIPMWTATQLVLLSVTLTKGPTRSIGAAVFVGASLYLASVMIRADSPFDVVAFGVVPWTIGVWGAATVVFSQREAVEALRERSRQLQENRDEAIRRSIAEERLRIARDLHDELAHHIAVISVSSGAVEVALPPDAEAARRALSRVRESSRGVLGELQRILHVLRADELPDATDPVLTDVEKLIESRRRAGMQIGSVTGSFDFSDLATDGQVAAYRIVQESLTNAERYGDGPVRLESVRDGSDVTIFVRNSVRAGISGPPGFGLIGMRERVERAGGQLTITERSGEFVLAARLRLHRTALTQ